MRRLYHQRKIRLLWLALSLTGTISSPAQSSSPWRAFRAEDGLVETPCSTVQIGAHGKVRATHPKSASISRLDGYGVEAITLPASAEKRIYESPGGQIWAVSREGLAELNAGGQWVFHPELETAQITAVFPVRQRVVLYLQSNRLMEYNGELTGAARSINLFDSTKSGLGDLLALIPARDGSLWMVGSGGLARSDGVARSITPQTTWKYCLAPQGVKIRGCLPGREDALGGITVIARRGDAPQEEAIRSDGTTWKDVKMLKSGTHFVWQDPTGRLWAATQKELVHVSGDEWTAVENDELAGLEINDIAVEEGGAFWLATSGGLFRHTASSWQPLTRAEVEAMSPSPDPGHFKTPPGSSAIWNTSLTARNGDLWVGSDHAAALLHENKWQIFASEDKTMPESAIAFIELNDGKIWCAAPNKIWEYDGNNWTVRRTGLDHINAMLRSREGSVWLGCNNGLHRFSRGAWIVNNMDDGLPGNLVRELFEDTRGTLVAVTSRGLAAYHPEVDRDAPTVFAQPSAKSQIPQGGTITLTFRASDKWRYTADDHLLFSHRMNDRDWSEFEPSSAVTFSDVPAGHHVFQVRAIDRNANISMTPAAVEFVATLPWYKETRLVWMSLPAIGIAIFFAALAVNRHVRLVRSYADIERKVAERTRELEKAHAELLHSQKMNALGTLAAGIAHDFNNILSIIKGSAQLIEENLVDPPAPVQTRLQRINTMVDQGGGIVKAMLGFARKSNNDIGPEDLNSIVEDTIKLLGDRFQREVSIRFEREPDLPEVIVGREFVQQILLNLLFNASEAMSDRKRIEIVIRRLQKLPDNLALRPEKYCDAESFVALSITDFGSGIAAENLPRIFEPFFTTKAFSSRRGTGLGLSMVYELARKMDAGLAVESVIGRGSTFTLLLWKAKASDEIPAESNTLKR